MGLNFSHSYCLVYFHFQHHIPFSMICVEIYAVYHSIGKFSWWIATCSCSFSCLISHERDWILVPDRRIVTMFQSLTRGRKSISHDRNWILVYDRRIVTMFQSLTRGRKSISHNWDWIPVYDRSIVSMFQFLTRGRKSIQVRFLPTRGCLSATQIRMSRLT